MHPYTYISEQHLGHKKKDISVNSGKILDIEFSLGEKCKNIKFAKVNNTTMRNYNGNMGRGLGF